MTIGSKPIGSTPIAANRRRGGGLTFTPASGYVWFYGYSGITFSYKFPPTLVTWIGAEVLNTGDSRARDTWIGVEVLSTILQVSLPRVSWFGLEVLRTIDISDEGFVTIIW